MLNICGCLVHAAPGTVPAVSEAIAALPGADIHAEDGGRIVVTVEDTDTATAADRIMEMHQIPGVLTVTLTYHHFEDPQNDASAPALAESHS